MILITLPSNETLSVSPSSAIISYPLPSSVKLSCAATSAVHSLKLSDNLEILTFIFSSVSGIIDYYIVTDSIYKSKPKNKISGLGLSFFT